jgi:hypothetical protein
MTPERGEKAKNQLKNLNITTMNNSNNYNPNAIEITELEPQKSDNLWKKVTFGTVSGILLGAGSIYAVDHFTDPDEPEDVVEDDPTPKTPEPEPPAPIYDEAPVATVSDSMSFSQAFAAARAQVGAGGVFEWHGGIYGTYYETEWNAMTDAQRSLYAHSVNPETPADHVQTDLMDMNHTDVVVKVDDMFESNPVHDHTQHHPDDGYTTPYDDADVHVVGYAEVDGHDAVAVDLSGDGHTDVVVIDVDDSGSLTESDILVSEEGNSTAFGDMSMGISPIDGQSDLDAGDLTADSSDYGDDASFMFS